MGYLQIAVLLLVAVYTCSADNTYVVLAPKTIRPGLDAKLQYNLRYVTGNVDITTTIKQNNAVKSASTKRYYGGQMVMKSLTVPSTLTAGTAKIEVSVTGAITHTSSADVTVQVKTLSIFIQTDKALYKPSQVVNFRVVIVDPQMMPYTGQCDVEIKDAQGNKIKQWKGLTLDHGVTTQLLELSDQPVLGDWSIKATAQSGESKDKTITIEKFVLPKFDVTVDGPSFILTSDPQIKVSIESLYTFGKGVDGTAVATISNPGVRFWGFDSITRQRIEPRTIEIKSLILNDGKVDITLTKDQLKRISANLNGLQNGNSVKIVANVTETLTGITRSGEITIPVHSAAEKLEFLESTPSSFKPGLKYTGFLKLSQVDGGVIINPRTANLRISYTRNVVPVTTTQDPFCSAICNGNGNSRADSVAFWNGNDNCNCNSNSISTFPRSTTEIVNQVITFPQNGLAQFSIDVPAYTTRIFLTAKYDNKTAVQTSKSVQETKSPSNSFVQLVLLSTDLQVGDRAYFRMTSTKPGQFVDYQIWSRGSLVKTGSVNVNIRSRFSVPVTVAMAPSARIIAYCVLQDSTKELVADSLNFNVDGALDRNRVSITYSKVRAQPGQSVNVRVTAAADSLVGLLAVDQSVLLLGTGNDITQADVMSELQSYDTVKTSSSPSPRFFRGFFPYSVSGTDTKTILDNSGLVALTNALVYKEQPIFFARRNFGLAGAPGAANGNRNAIAFAAAPQVQFDSQAGSAGPAATTQTEVTVRKIFPESWLWSDITTINGTVVVRTTIPDTITSWIASAFAVSNSAGLGVSADTAKLQVFKPFFVSLNLPFSVVRGEQVVLQAIVFNFMQTDADVTVTLPASNEYKSISVSSDGTTTNIKRTETVTIRAPANKGTSVSFPIIPSVIGQMKVRVTARTNGAADAVQRNLLVEAEGVEREYNQAVMIDLKNATNFKQTVAINFPTNVVSDSTRVEFSLIGDIMGPSITGLDKLIKLPFGCGEQNMLNFAPTIFVTDYLSKTSQLTSQLRAKSVGFMEKGYQRELTYQRGDGSFSAFGKRDPSGSMWLTAFVAKSFQAAKQFIFIDDDLLSQAVDWMIRRQNDDGSFPEPGRVIHKELLGGSATSTVTLTAYVLTSISEVRMTSASISSRLATAKSKAQTYLESNASGLSDPYSLALVSYALFKSGSNNVALTLGPLNRLAKNEGGQQYWEQPQPEPTKNTRSWRPPHQQGKAVNIELAAYVLQLKTERTGPSSAIPILRWISAQRNSNGGFSSTQDTVVALQALSKFAALAGGQTDMSVTMTSSAGNTHSFTVNRANSLVLQSQVLSPDVTSVEISATGSGLALASVSASYNVEDYEQEPAFSTSATVLSQTQNKITVRVCTRWLLTGTTGMAVMEIGIPSGFSADIEALELANIAGVKRVEEGNRKVIIYLDELTNVEKCIDVKAERTGLVAKARPVAVRVYDYYEPENQQTIFYSSTRLNNVNICDVCGATCEGCAAFLKRK